MEESKIIDKAVEDELRESYLSYAMSVIIGRAIPDVRDGMKPVHRRILYGMKELGLNHSSQHKKSARIVGEIMGKYHPHGDMSVYDALVRMAQSFSMRYTLVDGQGNFGSVDRDPAAAMRYTEARMTRIAEEMLYSIDEDTVDFIPNFDNTLKEPVVLPARLPNLLMNGASGIAVGMATNIPPHNLTELLKALIALLDNPRITLDELMQYVHGPDFPTRGIIIGIKGIKDMYRTGKGKIIIRSKAIIEEHKKRYRIVVTEIPYQVNKAALIKECANFAKGHPNSHIVAIRDESDKRGLRVVIELGREANPRIVLNQLFVHTNLQISYAATMLAIDKYNRPCMYDLKKALKEYLDHRLEVERRKLEYELKSASSRAHILEGLMKATKSIETVIRLIRSTKTVSDAKTMLIKRLEVTKEQASAILDMRLQRLTSLELSKISKEYSELNATIQQLQSILMDEEKLKETVKKDFIMLCEKYGDERLTLITEEESREFEMEDLIQEEDVVVTISHKGYISSVPLSAYRKQGRGGRGSIAMRTREEDYLEYVFATTTHSYLMIISNKGKAYFVKNYSIVQGSRGGKGKSLMNYLNLDGNERVKAVLSPGKILGNNWDLVILTRKGYIKRMNLSEFSARKRGMIAIKIGEDDEIIDAKLVSTQAIDKTQVLVSTRRGVLIRFPVSNVRRMGRTARGVRALRLRAGDEIAAMDWVLQGKDMNILSVTENGYGKLTPIKLYKVQRRGGIGLRSHKCTEKTGSVIGIKIVRGDEEAMLVTEQGYAIRIALKNLRPMGRITQGVKLMGILEGDNIVSLTVS